jgi:hypothetical protein
MSRKTMYITCHRLVSRAPILRAVMDANLPEWDLEYHLARKVI